MLLVTDKLDNVETEACCHTISFFNSLLHLFVHFISDPNRTYGDKRTTAKDKRTSEETLSQQRK
jgi:hypothetical protein